MKTSEPEGPVTGSNLLAGIRVLIADDHILFRRGFNLLFNLMFPGAQLLEASDANEAYELLERSPGIGLVIVDLTMPGMNGLQGVRRFVQHQPAVPLVILSAHTEPDEILECIKAGARAYIPKSADESIVQNAIGLVMAGETFIPSQAVRQIRPTGVKGVMPQLADLPAGNPLRQLTPRQCEALGLMIEGLSNKEIARELGLLESTVKAHVKAVLKKLDAQNRTHAALIATDLGWPRMIKVRS